MLGSGVLFAGGEGAGHGLAAAGLKHLWGIELEPKYAAIAQLNGFNAITADVTQIDFRNLPRVDFLHASPPCQRASVANAKQVKASKIEPLLWPYAVR